MPKKQITVEVESSGYELGKATADFVKAVVAAKKSGATVAAQAVEDLTAAIAAYSPVLGEVSNVGADLAESKTEFLKGLNLAAYDIVDATH